jgi:hypothetical protein
LWLATAPRNVRAMSADRPLDPEAMRLGRRFELLPVPYRELVRDALRIADREAHKVSHRSRSGRRV